MPSFIEIESAVGKPYVLSASAVYKKGNVGKIIWLPGDCYPIDTTYFVATDLPLRFVYRQLGTLEFVNSHAAVPGLNREQAYGLPFLLPRLDILTLFEEKAESISELATSLQQEVTTLTSIRDLLLPKLVTGKIDVSDLDLDRLMEEAAV